MELHGVSCQTYGSVRREGVARLGAITVFSMCRERTGSGAGRGGSEGS